MSDRTVNLTLVVPCYNSQEYMERCVDSLLRDWAPDTQVIIVNDGSQDGTARIADRYAYEQPERVQVVHKENAGHGSAINAGLALARGTYFKVVDSDDWLDEVAYRATLSQIREWAAAETRVDLLITNFVYEKQGRRTPRSVHYRRALDRGSVFGWEQVGRFLPWQYMLMHSMIYRTELLRDVELHVPERSFYVDNYFAVVPLPAVRSLSYLDVDLYRYHIGRADQSVNEQIMISRIDQQIAINLKLAGAVSEARRAGIAGRLERYMTDYVTLVSTVSSALLIRAGTTEALEKKARLWRGIERVDPDLAGSMRSGAMGRIVARDGMASTAMIRLGYHVTRLAIGFN